jgi:DNA-binding CsgD family transcriptional regulator
VTPLVDALTDREETVLLLLGDGYGLGEIAARLGISWWTARDHRDNARTKLQAATQTQAVAIVVRARAHPVT